MCSTRTNTRWISPPHFRYLWTTWVNTGTATLWIYPPPPHHLISGINHMVGHHSLLASAELRERRAFTSMMKYSSDSGLRAYCMLHSPTTPRCLIRTHGSIFFMHYITLITKLNTVIYLMTLIAVVRSLLYSLLNKTMKSSQCITLTQKVRIP